MMQLKSPLAHLVTIGAGEVVRERVRRAALDARARLGIERIAYFDVKPCAFGPAALDPAVEQFGLIPEGGSAADAVRRAGLLGPRTLVLVCTPTDSHVRYAREFAPLVGRVGVEKPTCHDPAAARGLLDFAGTVFPLGHQLFKREMLDFVTACRSGELNLGDVARLEFTLFEDKGVGARQVDDAVWDTGWHGIECAVAPVLALAGRVRVAIKRVRVATYRAGPDRPRAATAARIDAVLSAAARTVPVTIRVAKGARAGAKAVDVFGSDGRAARRVSLAEGGHHAHGRMIEELWSARPDMRLNLREVGDVVSACANAARRAEVMPAYPFGELPDWLTAGSDIKTRPAPEPPSRCADDPVFAPNA